MIMIYNSFFVFVKAKGVFILESEHLNRCIRADKTKLTLENCDQPSKHMLWKWVSRHRLFNIGSSMCLGLNTTSLQQPLNMFKCDSTLKTLWWRCSGNTLFGAAQLKLTGKGRLVVATKQRVSSQRWKIYLTSGEGPCAHPYEGKFIIYAFTGIASYLDSIGYLLFHPGKNIFRYISEPGSTSITHIKGLPGSCLFHLTSELHQSTSILFLFCRCNVIRVALCRPPSQYCTFNNPEVLFCIMYKEVKKVNYIVKIDTGVIHFFNINYFYSSFKNHFGHVSMSNQSSY